MEYRWTGETVAFPEEPGPDGVARRVRRAAPCGGVFTAAGDPWPALAEIVRAMPEPARPFAVRLRDAAGRPCLTANPWHRGIAHPDFVAAVLPTVEVG